MRKNCLKIWPKLIKADAEHHHSNGRPLDISLAEWIRSHSTLFLGKTISAEGAPLMAIDDLILFLKRQLDRSGISKHKHDKKIWAVFMLDKIEELTRGEELPEDMAKNGGS